MLLPPPPSHPSISPLQVSGLAIASANGLLLKGGKEAKNTNKFLHSLVQEALATEIPGHRGAIGLVRMPPPSSLPLSLLSSPLPRHIKDVSLSQVDSREEVGELLCLDDKIDLVIPRGGNELVKDIIERAQGHIPVLGHAEGICHVYVDQHADMEKALKVGELDNSGV